MKMDKIKSKKMIRIISFVVAFGLTSIGNGIMVSPDLIEDMEMEYLSKQFKMHQKQIEYLGMLNTVDQTRFDQNFISLFDDGVLKISEKSYIINDLYVVMDKANGINYLVSYKNPDIDILSGSKVGEIKDRSLVLFKNSSAFYDLYKLSGVSISNNQPTMDLSSADISKVMNIISTYSGEFHQQTPETYCSSVLK